MLPTHRGWSLLHLAKGEQQGNWDLACEVFPPLGTLRCATAWARLQAYTPDDLSFIGSFSELSGLVLALGSWYGFALTPAIGSAVANHLSGLPTPELDQLTPDRIAH